MPGTPVNLANGSYKNIEELQIGDHIKIYNENNKTIENAPINQIQKSLTTSSKAYEIILENGKTLQPTGHHPFLTTTKGWATIDGIDEMGINCAKIEIGDHVLQLQPNGTTQEIEITDIIEIDGTYTVYNFINMKHGTYLTDDIIVHNCFMPGTQINLANESYKNIEEIQIGDRVKVYNEGNNEVENASISSIQKNVQNTIYEIHLEDGKTLHPSSNHPFLTTHGSVSYTHLRAHET